MAKNSIHFIMLLATLPIRNFFHLREHAWDVRAQVEQKSVLKFPNKCLRLQNCSTHFTCAQKHARCVILKEKFMPMAGSSPKFQLAKSVPTLWNNFSSKVAWNSRSGGRHLGELLAAWYSLVALGTNLLSSRSLLLPLPCYFFLLFLASQPAVAGKADVNLVWQANKKW